MYETVRNKIKESGVSIIHIAKLFELDRTNLQKTLSGERPTYRDKLPSIMLYIDEVIEINNKFRRV